MALVTTMVGEVDERDLRQTLTEQAGSDDAVVAAREWVYWGSDPALAAYVGQQVRRDVWVVIKRGHGCEGGIGG